MQTPNTDRASAPAAVLSPRIAAALLVLILAAAASAEPAYEFFLVQSFNTSYALAETYVRDINDANVGVGTDTFGAFTWSEDGGKFKLPVSGARTLNNLGWVNYGHMLYHPDTEEEITIPEPSATYWRVTLRRVNDNMVGVGVATYAGPGCEPFNCPYDCGKAVVWDPVSGSYHVPVPDLKAFHAVNNHDVAVGVIIVNCDDNRGVVYDLRTGEWINLSELLPPLALVGRPAQIWPTDINDAGQVIGLATYGNEPQKPFVWTAETGFTFLPTIPGGSYGHMQVNKINNAGVVVGAALDDVALRWKSFIWDATHGIRVLEDLVEQPTNFMLENAYSINDLGWIAGSGHFGPAWATQRGYVLKPIVTHAPGDVNCDGLVSFADISPFIAALKAGSAENWTGPCPYLSADANGDGVVNFADISPFIALLKAPTQ